MRWGRRPEGRAAESEGWTGVTATAVLEHVGALTAVARERLADIPDSTALADAADGGRSVVHGWLERWLAAAGLSGDALDGATRAITDNLCGAGPLQALLDDPAVTEIIVNGLEPIWVEVNGRLRTTDLRFADTASLHAVIERLVAVSGRRVDEATPTVDARLADGSRLNAVLPPVAVAGPLLTIRRAPGRALDLAELVAKGSLSRHGAAFLHAAVVGRANLLVTGAAGAGKTTLLAALAGVVPDAERMVSVEDTSELRIRHPDWAALQCRPAGLESAPEVSIRDLVRNSLRMRPDRIIVGEVRGAEAADMVQAMNTGHAGSMTTLHANSAADSMARLEAMLAMAWPSLGIDVLRTWIGIAIDVVVHCVRDTDGCRRVGSISALELEGPRLQLVPLFGTHPGGELKSTGAVPRRCLARMRENGVHFPGRLLERVA